MGFNSAFKGLMHPDFHDIRHMKLVRSVSRNGCLYPQEIFLVLIFT